MNQLIGGGGEIFWVAVKALLLYLTAIAGFRLGERRTLAEMSAFDFVAAVAVGAIVGRVPNSNNTSYIEGVATLVTILVAHRIICRLRYSPGASALVDHSPRVLVRNGRVLPKELRRSGLTRDDLYGILRQHGVTDVQDVHMVVFEQRGKVSVLRRAPDQTTEPELVRDVLDRTGGE